MSTDQTLIYGVGLLTRLQPLGKDKICLQKVPAHRDIQNARSVQEAWQCFHNNYVDRAARLANQARPPCFWSQWEAHVKATGAAARIFQQVHALQMAVSKRQVKTVPVVAPAAKPPKVTREFAMEFERGAWAGQVPSCSCKDVWSSHARRAAHWLHSRLVTADSGSMVWVSFVQLYIDYQLSWGNPGRCWFKNNGLTLTKDHT